MQQRTKFDPTIAVNIDKQMSFQHVISLIFLTVENINAARNFCLKVEESEENVVLTVNDRNWSILQCLYSRFVNLLFIVKLLGFLLKTRVGWVRFL